MSPQGPRTTVTVDGSTGQTTVVDTDVTEVAVDSRPGDDTVVVHDRGPRGLQGDPGVGSPGPPGPPGPPGNLIDAAQMVEQQTPSTEWIIVHSLPFRPQVTIIDSAGTTVEGDITYVDDTTILAEFTTAFGGKAYLS